MFYSVPTHDVIRLFPSFKAFKKYNKVCCACLLRVL